MNNRRKIDGKVFCFPFHNVVFGFPFHSMKVTVLKLFDNFIIFFFISDKRRSEIKYLIQIRKERKALVDPFKVRDDTLTSSFRLTKPLVKLLVRQSCTCGLIMKSLLCQIP